MFVTTEHIERLIAELAEDYPNSERAVDGGSTLVRIPELYLPRGCAPETTLGLVVLDPTQPKPQFFVRQVPRLANGATPRNVTPTTVGGESWFTYSFNLQWDEHRNSAVQFVEGQLRRFALYE